MLHNFHQAFLVSWWFIERQVAGWRFVASQMMTTSRPHSLKLGDPRESLLGAALLMVVPRGKSRVHLRARIWVIVAWSSRRLLPGRLAAKTLCPGGFSYSYGLVVVVVLPNWSLLREEWPRHLGVGKVQIEALGCDLSISPWREAARLAKGKAGPSSDHWKNMYIYIYTCIYTQTCMCIYIYIYIICIHNICIYIYIHI